MQAPQVHFKTTPLTLRELVLCQRIQRDQDGSAIASFLAGRARHLTMDDILDLDMASVTDLLNQAVAALPPPPTANPIDKLRTMLSFLDQADKDGDDDDQDGDEASDGPTT